MNTSTADQSGQSNNLPPIESPEVGNHTKLYIILGALLVLGAAAAYLLLVVPSSAPIVASSNDAPPSLTVGEESGLKGSFLGKDGFLQFEANDVESFKDREKQYTAQNAAQIKLPKNTSVVFAEKQYKVSEIVDFMNPTSATDPKKMIKMLIAYYNPGENGKEGQFYTYPKSKFVGTGELKGDDVIPAGRPFIIITNGETYVYNLKLSNQPRTTEEAKLPDAALKGWVLLSLKTKNIGDELTPMNKRIAKVAALADNGTFEFVTDTATYTTKNQYVAWVKLIPGENDGKPVVKQEEKKEAVAEDIKIKSIAPDEIKVPFDAPTLMLPTDVVLNGSGMSSASSVEFDDPEISATIQANANYKATMTVTVGKKAKEGKHVFTITGVDGKKATGEIKITNKVEIVGVPKITTNVAEMYYVMDSGMKIELKGENLKGVTSVKFKDQNIKLSGVEAYEDFIVINSYANENVVDAGEKFYTLMVNNSQYDMEKPLTFITQPPKEIYGRMDFIRPGSYTLGTGPLKLNVIGTYMQGSVTGGSVQLFDEKNQYVDDAELTVSDSHKLTAEFTNINLNLKPGKYTFKTKLTCKEKEKCDKEKSFPFEILTNNKTPKITSISTSEFESGLDEGVEATITGENFDQDTKVDITNENGDYQSQYSAAVDVQNITLSEIKVKIKLPIVIEKKNVLIRVKNKLGVSTKPITILKSSKAPVIESITPSEIEHNSADPVTVVIKGKNLSGVTSVSATNVIPNIKIVSNSDSELVISFIPSFQYGEIENDYKVNINIATKNGSPDVVITGKKSSKAPKLNNDPPQEVVYAAKPETVTLKGENLDSIDKITLFGYSYYPDGQKSSTILEAEGTITDKKSVSVTATFDKITAPIKTMNLEVYMSGKYGALRKENIVMLKQNPSAPTITSIKKISDKDFKYVGDGIYGKSGLNYVMENFSGYEVIGENLDDTKLHVNQYSIFYDTSVSGYGVLDSTKSTETNVTIGVVNSPGTTTIRLVGKMGVAEVELPTK